MTALTKQQAEALDAYMSLMESSPQLFEGRHRRPIVTDLGMLRAYAAEHGVVLGIVVQTPYVWLVNDLVVSATDRGSFRHPYLRFMSPPQLGNVDGVVVLATQEDHDGVERVALLRIDRHATGTTELELPRGFGEAGASGAANAERELAEETGLAGSEVHYLGRMLTDTGMMSGGVSFFHIRVTGSAAAAPEAEESIQRVVFMTREQMWGAIDAGELRDAFTLQALALYERWSSGETAVGAQRDEPSRVP